jgi:hypothetical protein
VVKLFVADLEEVGSASRQATADWELMRSETSWAAFFTASPSVEVF